MDGLMDLQLMKQFNADGTTQNNDTGSGNQFPMTAFSGSIVFG